MTLTDDLIRTILGDHTNALRERRLRSLIEEDPQCLHFIRANVGALRSKFSPTANYEDFLDLFAELIWACLLTKGGARVQILPCRPGQRTPEYLVNASRVEFYGECRRLREPSGVSERTAGPITTYSYFPRGFGGEHDNQGARRISDAILSKLTQLQPGQPNALLLYTSAFGATPMFFNDALRLLESVDDAFLTSRGYPNRDAFLAEVNRISAIAYREEGRGGQRPRNIVTRVESAIRPLPAGILEWLENLDFDATALSL